MNFYIKDVLGEGNETTAIIAIVVTSILLVIGFGFLIFFNSKKKKCRKLLDFLRAKIQTVKQNDAIKNYSTYDNLKNDEKLGLLVVRWKKSIEVLVREIDAQYSMLDVLEDSINSNKFKNFYSLYSQVEKDVIDLENRAEELNDEIAEYINKASDNRKYISKYKEMFTELVEGYHQREEAYVDVQGNINELIEHLNKQFSLCQKHIKNSQFEEADKVASNIFDEIKALDHYLEVIPKLFDQINQQIEPKCKELKELNNYFNEEELAVIDETYLKQYEKYLKLKTQINQNVRDLQIEHTESHIIDLENFLDRFITILSKELNSKNYIIKTINYQKEYLLKIENTTKNFVSIFKVVSGTYNVSEDEVKTIEEIIYEIERIKQLLNTYEAAFNEKNTAFESLKNNLESTYSELTKISKHLDQNIKVIDEIYSDEKNAREKIALMTEKINGTKKFIKVANLNTQHDDLNMIKQINLQLTDIYVLLSEFPIDIIKLNQLIDEMTNKVEKMTKDINNKIYKALLTEYAILYANRYFSNKEMGKEITQAENLFYGNQFDKAYEKIMSSFDKNQPKVKRIILDKFQVKFNEIFN